MFFKFLQKNIRDDPDVIAALPLHARFTEGYLCLYNITGKWYLPNPTSPVFYLHFRDRISWIEADAVCQFHHSQLVTVNLATQFEDVRSYLKELFYEEPVWIGLRRIVPQGSFKWTDDSVLSTNEFWKEKPLTEEKLCVTSSPLDNYRWTAQQCNGPDVASFICEMPIPKWLQKSACLNALDPSITVTFHPEKSMIKAGKVCPNTDVKYIECHDPGKDEKQKENIKSMKEILNCPVAVSKNEGSMTSSTLGKITATTTSIPSDPTTDIQTSETTSSAIVTIVPKTTMDNFTDYNGSAQKEFHNKNMEIMEADFEYSTIKIPHEMLSIAEEPIKTSDGLTNNNSLIEGTTRKKLNITVINYMSTLNPTKLKAKETIDPTLDQSNENIIFPFTLLSTAANLLNSTSVEESHEVFNNDKDREVFQDSSTQRKSVEVNVNENVGNSLKNVIVSKSTESEEELLGDRTYNIEGTFDSNDFSNVDPIKVYKKIDLNPLDSTSRDTSYQTTIKYTEKSSTAEFTESPSTLSILSKTGRTDPTRTQSPVLKATSEATNQTTLNAEVSQNETVSSERPELKQKKISALLSGAQRYNENETNIPSRKRHIISSERHSFYPYFLGRILG